MAEQTLLLQKHDLDTLLSGVRGSGIEGPHTFIRGINADYDCDVMLQQWLRPIEPEDDFRFSVNVDDEDFWVLMERLPWDSDFFSMQTARLNGVLRPHRRAGLREDSSGGARALSHSLQAAALRGVRYVFAPVSPMIFTYCDCCRRMASSLSKHDATTIARCRLLPPAGIPSGWPSKPTSSPWPVPRASW